MIEAQNIPWEEKVYLKKDFLGWRVVNPIKNEDGTINWFNFILGGKRGIVQIIGITIIGILIGLSYQEVGKYWQSYYAITKNCFLLP